MCIIQEYNVHVDVQIMHSFDIFSFLISLLSGNYKLISKTPL